MESYQPLVAALHEVDKKHFYGQLLGRRRRHRSDVSPHTNKKKKNSECKKGQQKKFIALYKEQRALWQKQRDVVYVDLVPPHQKGWKRFFVLRKDVAASKQAPFYEEILRKINTVQYSDRKDFKVKKRKFGRKVYVERQQYLIQPCDYKFTELFSERERQMFYEIWTVNSHHKLIRQFVFVEPWRFLLRVKPNMITQVKLLDAELESQADRFEGFIERNHLECRMNGARTKKHKPWRRKDHYVRRQKIILPEYLKLAKDEAVDETDNTDQYAS